ncbi:MAG: orotidine-5'-phosphate decarboxylase, partial [Pseudomonadales bacterium]|nr:orotidine-5'-phosphate decarboxylase [Pseudomonadales bacterium]
MTLEKEEKTISTLPAFFERIASRQASQNTCLCIGLDPDPDRMPGHLKDDLFAFGRDIIDATADLVCCYKPQIAFYARHGAEDQLEKTIDYLKSLNIPVLLDAKRGDVGNTAAQYAGELFERYGADAVTINPYLGLDSIAPFLDYKDRGVFVLCRTSNAGGADGQNLILEQGAPLYEHIARE